MVHGLTMKECPVCHARCFEDMDTCYGCLHSFEEAEKSEQGREDPFEDLDVFGGVDVRIGSEAREGVSAKHARGPQETLSVPAITVVPGRGKALMGEGVEELMLNIRIPLMVGSVSAQYVEA